MHQSYIVYFYRKAHEMQVTVLHLQDDLEGMRISRYIKALSDIDVCITPKYGRFNKHEVEKCIKESHAIILLVVDPVKADDKTKKEINIAKDYGKPIYVISISKFKPWKELSKYEKVYLYQISDGKEALNVINKLIGQKHVPKIDKLVASILSLISLKYA